MPRATKLGKIVTNLDTFWPQSHMILQSCGQERSPGKLKLSYLHYHVYYHQTWKGCELLWGVPPINSHDHIISGLCEIMWQTKIISTTTMLIATKLDRVGIYNEDLPSIKLQGPLIKLWEASTHKVIQPFENVRSPGRVVTYNEELLSLKLQDPLIT